MKTDQEPPLQADRLATELSAVRRRGINHLERHDHRQRVVATPLLDALAAVPPAASSGVRVEMLRAYLQHSIAEYKACYGAEAHFIEVLLFDAHGNTPGPAGPAGLLREARSANDCAEETFRRLQRQHFLDFAQFVITTRLATPPRSVGVPVAVLFLVLALMITLGVAVALI